MSKQEKAQILANEGFKRKFIFWNWLFFKINKIKNINHLYFQKGINGKKLSKLNPTDKYILNSNKLLLVVDEENWIKELDYAY